MKACPGVKIIFAGGLLLMAISCSLKDKFPGSIKDIDTLSIYKIYNDSANRALAAGSIQPDSIAEKPSAVETTANRLTRDKWTISLGVFRIKENARKTISGLPEGDEAFLVLRDSMFYVTTGVFVNRDSALIYLKRQNKNEAYPIRIKPHDRVLSSQ